MKGRDIAIEAQVGVLSALVALPMLLIASAPAPATPIGHPAGTISEINAAALTPPLSSTLGNPDTDGDGVDDVNDNCPNHALLT